MKNLIYSFVVLGFTILNHSNSDAGKFNKYEKELNRVNLSCEIHPKLRERIVYSSNGKNVYVGRDAQVVGWNGITAVDKQKGKNVFIITKNGKELYLNFEERVVIEDGEKQNCY